MITLHKYRYHTYRVHDMSLILLKIQTMLTAFFVSMHASRSATTTAFLYPTIRTIRIFQYPTARQNQPTTKRWLSSFPPADGSNSNSVDDTTVFGIPSMEQLRTDSFMKQVQHAEFITGLIQEDNGRETDVLMNRLRAQLSHPDGIRGFMVTYLTTSTDDSNDSITIPPALIKAIIEQIDPISDKNELISLMCMNVIMPTGMITMQPNEELSQQSAATAKRATLLLKQVLDLGIASSDNENKKIRSAIISQCHAILAVATEASHPNVDGSSISTDEDKLQTFWRTFFQKWGYQSQQQSDIAVAMRTVLSQQL